MADLPAPVLAEAIKALSPAAKLRLAADLLEKKRADLAHVIANSVVVELGAAMAIRAMQKREARSG